MVITNSSPHNSLFHTAAHLKKKISKFQSLNSKRSSETFSSLWLYSVVRSCAPKGNNISKSEVGPKCVEVCVLVKITEHTAKLWWRSIKGTRRLQSPFMLIHIWLMCRLLRRNCFLFFQGTVIGFIMQLMNTEDFLYMRLQVLWITHFWKITQFTATKMMHSGKHENS